MVRDLVILMVLVAGAGLPFQAAVNARLGSYLGHPLGAALANFTVGWLIIVFFILMLGVRPGLSTALQGPWWLWLGGFFGVMVVVASILAAPRLGTALLVGLLIGGQMLSSLMIDHYGWFGVTRHPISWSGCWGCCCW